MEIQWNYTVYVCANCANQPKMFLLFAASKIGHVKPQKHGGIFFISSPTNTVSFAGVIVIDWCPQTWLRNPLAIEVYSCKKKRLIADPESHGADYIPMTLP